MGTSKLDRELLQRLAHDPEVGHMIPLGHSAEAMLQPMGERQEALHHVWCEVLLVPPSNLSVTADFFHLGGHSLLAARCAGVLARRYGFHLSVEEILNRRTIERISEVVAVGAAEIED